MSKELNNMYSLFANDDCKLELTYPDAFEKHTELSEEEIRRRFFVFGRLFFNQIFTKERKELNLIKDEKTGEWLLTFPMSK